MTDDSLLRERLDELDERVRQLEHRDTVEPPHGDQGTYWIVEGITSRGGDAVVYGGVAEGIEWQYGRSASELLAEEWLPRAPALASLGNPVRLRILQAIARGATTVAELTELDGIGTTGQIYHHLNLLVGHGWLEATSRGHYGIPVARLVPLLAIMTAID